MNNFNKIQQDVKNHCLNILGKIPYSWNVEKNEKGSFCFDEVSKKRRYGRVKNCEHCNREFIAIKDSISSCSCFCANQKKVKKVKVQCSWCKKEILKPASKLKYSKSGLFFCQRKCKDEAQRIDGLTEIHPSHYQDGHTAYSEKAFKHYGSKCVDCDITFKNFLQVHHKD